MSETFFQRTLQDLIKGIRNHKKDPSGFISQSIVEIKNELKLIDPFIKAEAVRKLTYLQMIGYNMSWASFSIVEVMSQSRFAHKRIGYLAANQTFDESTDVILLTTNLFKKELMTSSQYEIGLAINCLANIATKELARDCLNDLVILINHSKPYVRKKAILAMYKLYVKYPQGLRLTFDKLKERLEDLDSSVVSTAVNVICELANKNPKNYLAMAPMFFKLLTTSSNNWMLIKVVKLLGSLVTEEPRLARKLLDPLATIIQNTGAKSLKYECIYTITEALPYSRRDDGTEAKNAPSVIKLCSDYLRSFVEDTDQNLKYLGLVGLCNLLRSSPKSVVEHRDLILKCLNDDDVTIRTKALELLAGIASKKSLVELIKHLMEHAHKSEGTYRDEIITTILTVCKQDKYDLVSDFAWYTSILLDLAVMRGSKHGQEVADQLIEIALRVDTVRPFAVETMLSMILNETLIFGHARFTVAEVLKAAAWIVGEYSEIVSKLSKDNIESVSDPNVYWIEAITGEEVRSIWRGQRLHFLLIKTFLSPKTTNLPIKVQIGYIHSAMKLFLRACRDCEFNEIADCVGVLRNGLPVFMQSIDLEVQERATSFRYLLSEFCILPLNWETTSELVKDEYGEASDLIDFLPVYTAGSTRQIDENGARNAIASKTILSVVINEPFYAVHSKAQRKVPIPSDLLIEEPFNAKALNKLIDFNIPDTPQIAALTLVQESTAFPSTRDNEEDPARLLRSGNLLKETENNDLFKEVGTANGRGNYVDDVFMLSVTPAINNDLVPLSNLLGENGDELVAKSKKVKQKKSTKVEVDRREMLPAGAISSDEEYSKAKKKRSKRKEAKSEDGGLAMVDITNSAEATDQHPIQQGGLSESHAKDIPWTSEEELIFLDNDDQRQDQLERFSSVEFPSLLFTSSDLQIFSRIKFDSDQAEINLCFKICSFLSYNLRLRLLLDCTGCPLSGNENEFFTDIPPVGDGIVKCIFSCKNQEMIPPDRGLQIRCIVEYQSNDHPVVNELSVPLHAVLQNKPYKISEEEFDGRFSKKSSKYAEQTYELKSRLKFSEVFGILKKALHSYQVSGIADSDGKLSAKLSSGGKLMIVLISRGDHISFTIKTMCTNAMESQEWLKETYSAITMCKF